MAETHDGTTVDQLTQHRRGRDPRTEDGPDAVDHRDIGLHHVHLPMLHEADVIDYDVDQGVVYRSRAFQNVHSLLEIIDSHREETAPPAT
jgi:hypothetical protein